MATIPKNVSERLAKETRRFQRILRVAKDKDINESDTVIIITDMLAEVFGFDKYTEVTSEYVIKGQYCDLAIKVDESVKYLIEVKAIGLSLKDIHLKQVVSYGAQQGVQWVVLTNGVDWEIYRIKFEKPLGQEQLCAFNFLELSTRKKEDLDLLFLLSKEGLSRAVIEEYHEHIKSVNRYIIGAILQTDKAFNMLRTELRRVSPGLRVDVNEIQTIVENEVLKREVVQGNPAEEAIATVKRSVAARAAAAKRKAKSKTELAQAEPEEPQ